MAAENGHVPQAIQAASTFEKLDGVGNYNTWKFQMKMTLVLEGLWKCVGGTDTDSTKDQRALARICLGIKSCFIQHVRSANTAKEAWDALKSVFEDKGLYRRVLLLRQLHRANYTHYNSMNEYIEGVMTLVQQLADIGRVIEDKEVAEILLSGLPQEYDVLVSSLESLSSLEALTSEMVRARLLQEHFRRVNNGNNENKGDNMGFMTSKRNVVCSYCKRTGHVKAKCSKLKREKAASKQKTETGTLFVSASAFATCLSSHCWIVDSGCTSHMCKDKALFLNLDTSFTTLVTVANNDQLKCLGIGNVELKFKNDTKIIENVMYVPGLSANLLSVSCLTKNNRRVVFDNSKCHIYDVAGNLLTSAIFTNGIYRLECMPKVLCSQVSSNVLQFNKEQCSHVHSAQMELWHRRLGH
uniref:Retrovirus-related Pol polyprotein from transposon TNT 1-94-like beta-barrel domain-containing protein n=1 Tax=Heliothis virescens TaxID=7102 RepID=A0A2A4JC36_HELVI